MKSHEETLLKYMKKYKDNGWNVIRLDRRGIPDAILIKDNRVVPLLIDTRPISVLYANTQRLRNEGHDHARDYSEFTEIIQVVPARRKRKRYYKKDEYDKAMKLWSDGERIMNISKALEIPWHVINSWVKEVNVPWEVKDYKIIEKYKNMKLIYDLELENTFGTSNDRKK